MSHGFMRLAPTGQNFSRKTTKVNETLIIADYEYGKIFRLTVLDIKLWPKDDNVLHRF